MTERDIFGKCRQFYSNSEFAQKLGWPVNPRMAEALGLYPYFIPIDEAEGTEVTIGDRRLIMIGSNNYLGLTTHSRVRELAAASIARHGTSCTGSRFLNGTLQIHHDLEDRLAAFVGKEKALVFSTGFQTNLGVITALAWKGDVVVCDKKSHASIIDAVILAKGLHGAEPRYFRHNDLHGLERILKSYPPDRGKLVVVDGVYSMLGDLAPLPDIIDVCRRYGARLLVDDAHGIGVTGHGRGTAAHFDCTDDVDLIVGTFSKSLASMGGFVAGDKEVIHWIQHFGRSFMFSASLSPANVATVLAALDVIESEPERVERVNDIAETVRTELRLLGYNIGNSQTPIVPVVVGDQFGAMQAWDMLFRAGIYTNVVLPPAVPANLSMLRTSYMATHTDGQIATVIDAFSTLRDRIQVLEAHGP